MKNRVACIMSFVTAILLFGAMCATVGFCYARAICAMEHHFTSAPPEVVFLMAIPFVFGISIFAVLGIFFYRKAKRASL